MFQIETIGFSLLFSMSSVISLICAKEAYNRFDSHLQKSTTGLFLYNGIWGFVEFLRIILQNTQFITNLYYISLTFAVLSVLFWMYCCSVLGKKEYHKSKNIVVSFTFVCAVIIFMKLTNPIHNWYLPNVTVFGDAFNYVVVVQTIPSLSILFGSYLFSIMGYFWILQRHYRSKYLANIILLGVIITFTSLISLLTVFIETIPNFWYESLSVTVFSVVFFFTFGTYSLDITTSRYNLLKNEFSEPIILLSEEQVIIEMNSVADQLLSDASIGDNFWDHITEFNSEFKIDSDDSNQTLIQINNSIYELTIFKNTSSIDKNTKMVILSDNTDLYESLGELNRHNEQLKDLSGIVTHQLRNSLTVINGNIKILQEKRNSPENQQYFDSIMESIDRLNTVTDRLYSVTQVGKSFSTKDTFMLSDVCQEYSSVTVESDGEIYANRDQFCELIQSIERFNNGSDSSKVTISHNQNSIQITYYDISFSPKLQREIFEYGNSAPNPQLSSILPIIKTISNNHGWTISHIETDELTFSFSIEGVNDSEEEKNR